MSPVDWIIIGVVVLLALFGWARGFLAGALSLIGFVLGAFIGTRLGPHLLPDGSQSPYAPLFGLVGALVAGAILATGFEGIGAWLRRLVPVPGLGAVDAALGAVWMGCLALALAWVVGAVALQVPGARKLRRDIQRSVILSWLNDVLPSRELLNALARFDPFPQIAGPDVDVPAPDPNAPDDPQIRAAAASVVKIHGTACGLGVEGSGWVARPGIVVTNAHVVAGMQDASVLARGAGPGLPATAVHFDPRNDVAVLRVGGLDAPALGLAPAPDPGTVGAILGFPHDGPYRVRAARVGVTRSVFTQDAYGRGPLRRSVTAIRGRVESGNSGGPVVDRRGRVLTTVFAATTSGARGGYGVPVRVVREALGDVRGTVSTGPCAR